MGIITQVDGGGPNNAAKPPTPPPTPHDFGGEGPASWTFGDEYAGFGLGQQQTIQQYDQFLKDAQAHPIFGQLLRAYGAPYQQFHWDAYRSGMDPIDYENALTLQFPDWTARIKAGGGGGGGRGGGGSYGGGGASKAMQFAAAEAAIRNQSQTLGLPMDDAAIKKLARTVVNDNWSNDQLFDHLLVNPAAITNEGSYSATVQQLKGLASSQLVTLSDASAKDWAKRMLSGEMALETVSTILQQQALAEFGWASDALTAGATMRDVLAPARDTIAGELEVNPATIDLMDPKWRGMVQSTNADGTTRAVTMTEAVRAARKDTAYTKTAGAARLASQTAAVLRNMFEG